MSTQVDCVVGIDLGSTTTKAVILDADERILGRGITNSRSNYDIACAVARSEALVDARLELARRALSAEGGLDLHADKLLPALEASFRRARNRLALDHLSEALAKVLAEARHDERRAALAEVLVRVREGMEAEFERLHAADAPRRSEFFRDLASSSYMRLAEELADADRAPYDVLLVLFDKAILEVENQVLDLSFERHAESVLEQVAAHAGLDEVARARAASVVRHALEAQLAEHFTVGTGYGRARLPFPKKAIRSEILCHGLGAHVMFGATRTVLDIGGQDTKAIQVDDQGIVTSFQMNDRCAAGCGRYLGYIADEMNMGVHELGPLAMQSTRHVKINSTCTVFAGAELRDRLNLGQRREDILAGLHRAIMLRAMSLLARSGGVENEFTFTGGVARNEAAVQALRELIAENYGERTLNISPDSIYTGALGASLFALRAWTQGEEAEASA